MVIRLSPVDLVRVQYRLEWHRASREDGLGAPGACAFASHGLEGAVLRAQPELDPSTRAEVDEAAGTLTLTAAPGHETDLDRLRDLLLPVSVPWQERCFELEHATADRVVAEIGRRFAGGVWPTDGPPCTLPEHAHGSVLHLEGPRARVSGEHALTISFPPGTERLESAVADLVRALDGRLDAE